MDEFIEHLMYTGLFAGNSEMNQTHPCHQGAPSLVREDRHRHTMASGFEAAAQES